MKITQNVQKIKLYLNKVHEIQDFEINYFSDSFIPSSMVDLYQLRQPK